MKTNNPPYPLSLPNFQNKQKFSPLALNQNSSNPLFEKQKKPNSYPLTSKKKFRAPGL